MVRVGRATSTRLLGPCVAIALTLSVGVLSPLDHAIASGATSPSPCSYMGMTYDAARGKVVLFGGYGSHGAMLADTWTWDGTNWTQEHPATSPPARAWMGMAYDAWRGR